MPSQVFNSKRHDTAIALEITFDPPLGVTWNLQEAGLRADFIARLPGSTSPKVNAQAAVTGPWTVSYAPAPADVDSVGTFDVEVEVLRSNGKKVTFPTLGFLTWVIGPDLDNS